MSLFACSIINCTESYGFKFIINKVSNRMLEYSVFRDLVARQFLLQILFFTSPSSGGERDVIGRMILFSIYLSLVFDLPIKDD